MRRIVQEKSLAPPVGQHCGLGNQGARRQRQVAAVGWGVGGVGAEVAKDTLGLGDVERR